MDLRGDRLVPRPPRPLLTGGNRTWETAPRSSRRPNDKPQTREHSERLGSAHQRETRDRGTLLFLKTAERLGHARIGPVEEKEQRLWTRSSQSPYSSGGQQLHVATHTTHGAALSSAEAPEG